MTSVMVTRARHPLQGRSLQVLGQMCRHGQMELLVVLPDGSKSLIPAAWTDRDAAAGQAAADEGADATTLGTLADLLGACVVVSALVARAGEAEGQAARQPPCKEDNRAACTAQSDARPATGATPGRCRPPSRAATGRGDQDAGPADRQGRGGDCPGGRR